MSGVSSRPKTPEIDPDRRKLVANERIKASAGLANSVASAMLATGVIGPLAADLYGVTVPKSPYWWVFIVWWVVGGVVSHISARKLLESLEP